MNKKTFNMILGLVFLLLGGYMLLASVLGLGMVSGFSLIVRAYFPGLAFCIGGLSRLFVIVKNEKLNAIANKVSYAGLFLYIIYIAILFLTTRSVS